MESLYYVLYFALLIVLAVVMHKIFRRKDINDDLPQDSSACNACSSEPGKCLHDCVIENSVGDIEYFDDEELDEYKGRTSDSYTDEEAGQFAEVMYTMKPEEVKDWLKSLNLRDVNLPDQLKDEAIMLVEG